MQEKQKIVFQTDPPAVKLAGRDTMTDIPALWLRENSADEASVDIHTRQRLFDSHLIDPDLQLLVVEVRCASSAVLTFSDGHSAKYTEAAILAEICEQEVYPQATAWGSDIDLATVRHDWRALNDDSAFAAALEAYFRNGFIVLTDVPNNPEEVLVDGSKFGYVKETNFGKYFEVYSKPMANDLAYRSVRLGPHTDNPYRDPVPGIQLLHCLINETSGGLSTLVDSIRVVEVLRLEDPAGYQLLKNTPVRFRFVDQGVELTCRRPMISTDEQGNTLGVHYSPRLDSLPLLSQEETSRFHKARKRLAELFNDPVYELKFRLQAGELMLFDNSRVLHGRTSYETSEGRRHLQGCYIDLDGPRERYSEIAKRLSKVEEAA